MADIICYSLKDDAKDWVNGFLIGFGLCLLLMSSWLLPLTIANPFRAQQEALIWGIVPGAILVIVGAVLVVIARVRRRRSERTST
ncbi:MAG: hypothetical protein DRN04_14575 [Thermoprotei archaeon]|nr:MAG: hypothetical protein DRN04_14575 [Thermoprotei archaeon]